MYTEGKVMYTCSELRQYFLTPFKSIGFPAMVAKTVLAAAFEALFFFFQSEIKQPPPLLHRNSITKTKSPNSLK